MITFQKILVEKGDEVLLLLRPDVQVTEQKVGEAILDVNQFGNWIGGLELLSVFLNFSLEKAVRPFDPVPISLGTSDPTGTVTYEKDDGDEMVYIYMLYDDNVCSLPHQERALLLKIDHQIENPHCRFGLDSEGGLVYVRLPMADLSSPPETLLALLRK